VNSLNSGLDNPFFYRQQHRSTRLISHLAAFTCALRWIAPILKIASLRTPIPLPGPKSTEAKILRALYTILLGTQCLESRATLLQKRASRLVAPDWFSRGVCGHENRSFRYRGEQPLDFQKLFWHRKMMRRENRRTRRRAQYFGKALA